MVDGHHGHHHHAPDSIARHNSFAHGIHLPEDTCGDGSGGATTLTINHGHHHHDHIVPLKISESSKGDGNDECPDEQNNWGSSIRALLTLVALSFHELMEGLAIGLQVGYEEQGQ